MRTDRPHYAEWSREQIQAIGRTLGPDDLTDAHRRMLASLDAEAARRRAARAA